jgi:hypothetical protein
MLKRLFRFLPALAGVLVAWCFSASDVAAQYVPVAGAYPPGYGYGAYPPWGYGPGSRAAGVWYGTAAVIDAYGNYAQSIQQANILGEQANQAHLDTKMKAIDVMAYERANKYWYSDEKADIESKKVQAAMNNPPIQEITSGRSLNVLLPFIDKQLSLGVRGPTVIVDPEIVKAMNVTSGDDGGNAGLLRDIDNLDWPPALEGENQKKLDEMLKQAAADATKKQITSAVASKLTKQADTVEKEAQKKFQKSQVDGTEYLEGLRFLERVREAIKAMKQPSITKILAGAGGPQGDTVDQVVYSMTSKGLTFAKAQPGQEGAYVAMHRAFVNFALGTGVTDTGFRVRLAGSPGGYQAKKDQK